MKRPQTKFHAHTLRESQVIRSKKSQNLSLGQTFLAAQFFSLYRYFIKTTRTDIGMILQVLLQFCNNNGFAVISDVIMLFFPLLDDEHYVG